MAKKWGRNQSRRVQGAEGSWAGMGPQVTWQAEDPPGWIGERMETDIGTVRSSALGLGCSVMGRFKITV